MRHIDAVVIHHSASPPWTRTHEVRRWHVAPKPDGNGWDDIGYHLVVEKGGELRPGRPFDKTGAHVFGHNDRTLGFLIMGDNMRAQQGLDRYGWSSQQIAAARLVLRTMLALRPNLEILPHYELNPRTECPGREAFENLMEGLG